jgi:hypothetical protein
MNTPHSLFSNMNTPEACSTCSLKWICWVRSSSGVIETWWGACRFYACPAADSIPDCFPPGVKTGRSNTCSL